MRNLHEQYSLDDIYLDTQTRDENDFTKELCWFCSKQSGNKNTNLIAIFYIYGPKTFSMANAATSQTSQSFRTTTVKISRCKNCFEAHLRKSNVAQCGFVYAVVAFILFFFISAVIHSNIKEIRQFINYGFICSKTAAKNDAFFIQTAIVVVIGFATGAIRAKLINNKYKEIIMNSRPKESISEHPFVRGLFERNWTTVPPKEMM